MDNELVLFHTFVDYDSLQEFSDFLTNAGIENKMQNNNHAYVSVVGYNQVDIPYGINVRQQDFPKADKLLEDYYTAQIQNVDRSYYLFEEPNSSLLSIIKNPYDNGKLDLVLARHILNERGVDGKETDIEQSKTSQLASEKQLVPVSKFRIVVGYILAVCFPFMGAIVGISIYYNRKLLGNGERFYLHTTKERRHGKNMIIISIIAVALLLTDVILQNSH